MVCQRFCPMSCCSYLGWVVATLQVAAARRVTPSGTATSRISAFVGLGLGPRSPVPNMAMGWFRYLDLRQTSAIYGYMNKLPYLVSKHVQLQLKKTPPREILQDPKRLREANIDAWVNSYTNWTPLRFHNSYRAWCKMLEQRP